MSEDRERLKRLKKKGLISDEAFSKKDSELAEKIRRQRKDELQNILEDLKCFSQMLS